MAIIRRKYQTYEEKLAAWTSKLDEALPKTTYRPTEFGKRRPQWTKTPCRGWEKIIALAAFICSRTPPRTYRNKTELFMIVVSNNHSVFGSWYRGYEILTDAVWYLLQKRDYHK